MSKEKYDKTRYKYVNEIQQMMFVFGEVSDPLVETANVIEDIVRSQVIEIIIMAAAVAQNRGGRFMTAEDLIFLIRHDKSKVARLKTYLSWKEVRKNVKDSGGGPEGGGDELLEETNADKPDKAKKSRMKLCWEFVYGFPEALANESDDDDEELDEVDDSTVRLKRADEVTRAMTRAQYEHYSECRQASFTYRRGKRFREWSNMSTYIDMKPNEDIIDILGFLTFEMVSKLTETGLSIKEGQERDQRNLAHASNARLPSNSDGSSSGGATNGTNGSKDSGATVGPFAPPPTGRTPLLPAHIQEAFRRMQRSNQPIKNFRGGLARSRVSLI